MAQDFPYKSLHEYLDKVFVGLTPSESEIAQAKKEYWKAYNTHLKQNQRKKHKEVTLAFNKKEWQSLLERLNPNQSLHGYIKELLNRHIDKDSIATLEQLLYKLQELLEDKF